MKLIASLSLLTIIALENISSGVAQNSTLPETMFFIGTADGKNLYGDRTKLSWFDAKGYCYRLGMTLVSVDTEAKYKLLESMWLEDYRKIWTSGRDAQTLRMISWDDTNQMPNLTSFQGSYVYQYQVCLLAENSPGFFVFFLERCGTAYQILCEKDAE